MALQKTRFAQQMISLHVKLAEVMDAADAMEKEYFDQGYDSGGSDPIVDDDVVNLGIKAADITAGITLLQQQNKLFTNQAVTAADYEVTVNKFRRAGS
jgi:hypothetical protein